MNANGGFTYVRPSGFGGMVQFSYKAHDGIAYSAVQTVYIMVYPQYLTLDGEEKEDEAGASSYIEKSQVRDVMHEAIARWQALAA